MFEDCFEESLLVTEVVLRRSGVVAASGGRNLA